MLELAGVEALNSLRKETMDSSSSALLAGLECLMRCSFVFSSSSSSSSSVALRRAALTDDVSGELTAARVKGGRGFWGWRGGAVPPRFRRRTFASDRFISTTLQCGSSSMHLFASCFSCLRGEKKCAYVSNGILQFGNWPP